MGQWDTYVPLSFKSKLMGVFQQKWFYTISVYAIYVFCASIAGYC